MNVSLEASNIPHVCSPFYKFDCGLSRVYICDCSKATRWFFIDIYVIFMVLIVKNQLGSIYFGKNNCYKLFNFYFGFHWNQCNTFNCVFLVKPMECSQLYVSIQLGTFHRFQGFTRNNILNLWNVFSCMFPYNWKHPIGFTKNKICNLNVALEASNMPHLCRPFYNWEFDCGLSMLYIGDCSKATIFHWYICHIYGHNSIRLLCKGCYRQAM